MDFLTLKILIKRMMFEIRNQDLVKDMFAILIFIQAKFIFLFNKNGFYRKIMQAHRITSNLLIKRKIEYYIKGIIKNTNQTTYLYNNYNLISRTRIEDITSAITKRIIVLKNPKYRNGVLIEKGVLYVMFTPTIKALSIYYDIKKLVNVYYMVLEPSWAGYCDPDILFLANISEVPIFVCATEAMDFNFILRLNSNLLPVHFGASNWVDPDIFKPLAIGKKYDGIMVALWQEYKRHHILFNAVSKIRDKSYRIALVGMSYKGSKHEINKLVEYYGLQKQVDLYEDISPKEVNSLINQSKVNILLSKKEGSNRTIFEGFFANVPGIVLANNIGVNKEYINAHTGSLIDEEDLTDVLLYYRNNYMRFSPRQWALKNISPMRTTEILNNIIKVYALINGETWTEGSTIKVNRPELEYYDKNDYTNYLSPLNLLKI